MKKQGDINKVVTCVQFLNEQLLFKQLTLTFQRTVRDEKPPKYEVIALPKWRQCSCGHWVYSEKNLSGRHRKEEGYFEQTKSELREVWYRVYDIIVEVRSTVSNSRRHSEKRVKGREGKKSRDLRSLRVSQNRIEQEGARLAFKTTWFDGERSRGGGERDSRVISLRLPLHPLCLTLLFEGSIDINRYSMLHFQSEILVPGGQNISLLHLPSSVQTKFVCSMSWITIHLLNNLSPSHESVTAKG